MAPRSSSARKTLSTANLAALGAERLATLLIEATVGDTNLKRRLKLELAAEVGPGDLALEIDKRMNALAASRTRVSWRKRPELIADLQVHRRAIVERLAPNDAGAALDRLSAWLDLYPGLTTRVKDPKGELSDLFFAAAEDLGAVATAAGPDRAAPVLAEAVETRLSEWGGWIGRAATTMSPALAMRLLEALTAGRPSPTGRRALVVRKLADRAGDARAWAGTFAPEDRARPEVGAQVARRLAAAGLAEAAREALDRARPRPTASSRRREADLPPEPSPVWDAAEIEVLEAEGRTEDAQRARWAAFERSLDETALRAFVSRLADFDDVEAIDRAHAVAAGWGDATRGLAFLMAWPALREAAAMIRARAGDLRGLGEEALLWIARLEGRYPDAALILVRSRARSLAALGPSRSAEVRALSAEAAELALRPGAVEGLESHAAFIDSLDALASRPSRWG
ncbi:hypothetical protein BZG35_14920 [Brevundimonas sp. LM2]|uniref:DUF6880 family protein n=1 Tax=Brevundimonas sp. LM2 TaxID=1938605 RepID=UPI000983A300|nr:DUF6880 family protein [Brevundimonas sp. LM2]AQR62800.1 hypothetical protein BZG35_14920 [Brevundimonas sp. LM2]